MTRPGLMRRTRARTRALAALAALAAIAGAASAQGFNALAAKDPLDVWVVGDGGAVFRSLDGGATWGSYPLGSAEHRGVAARGAGVWIVDANGTIWRSTDTGYSFTSDTPAGATPLNAVYFDSDTRGWIAANNGTLLRTVDAGQGWTAGVSGTTANLYAVHFRDALEGWACGATGTVLHTTDGGANWSPPAGSIGFDRDLYDIACIGDTVVVSGTYAFTAMTVDAGQSWTPMDLEITTRSDVKGLVLRPGGTLWLCGGGGFLRRTQDQGAHWFYPQHKIMSPITDVLFTDASHGWACAERSKNVARTSDGGATWSIPGGGDFTYGWFQMITAQGGVIRGNTFALNPNNRNRMYVVQGKRVFASSNRGDTWALTDTVPGMGNRVNAFLVSPSDSNKWLAIIQDADHVARTTNHGATWDSTLGLAYTEYGMPLEQDPGDPEHVLFAPEDGHVYESFDFGATWSQMANTPLFRSPDDIVIVPDTTGILYLSDGVTGNGLSDLFRSTDAGLHWTSLATGPGSEIPAICSSRLDHALGFATHWSGGGVDRTTNFGGSWTSVSTTPSAWGVDIAQDDPNVVAFAIYSGGQTFISLDRGATWLSGLIGGSNYALWAYDRSTILCHQSTGVWKAVFSQPDMPTSNGQSLTLTRPNGSETFQYGATEPVLWSSQNLATVKLEVQFKPQGPWVPLISDASGPPGQWAWPVGASGSSSAVMRVSDPNDGSPLDVSNGTFEIIVPGLLANPQSLAFGDLAIGANASDTVHIVNYGTATLVVSSVTVAHGGPFTPNRTSFSIPPGGADSVIVVFEPATAATYDDTLYITHNAPGSPALVALSGAAHDVTAIGPGGDDTPLAFGLRHNAPNPFGASGTVIGYALPEPCDVTLDVFNVMGQRVATLVNAHQPAGRYAVRFPGAGATLAGGAGLALPSGVYFCRLRAGAFVESRRMMLVR